MGVAMFPVEGQESWNFFKNDVSNHIPGLRFRPTGNITFPDKYARPVNEDLATIPVGSLLYQVYALDAPEELGGKEKRIADLVLTSKLVTSKWGDEHLFFRHQDMAEDLRLRPAWNKFSPQWAIFP